MKSSSINFEEKYTIESNPAFTDETQTNLIPPSTPRKPIELKSNTNFAKNEIFMPMMKNPDLYAQSKQDIIAYLQSQSFDQYINQNNLENMLWGINEPTAMKHKNNVYARCSDNYDTIVKMYHLAKMTEQDDIAKSIQDKIILVLQSYFDTNKEIDRRYSDIYYRITKIALAFDCYENIKSILYNGLLLKFEKYTLTNTSFEKYFELLNIMSECELLDATFANKVKLHLPKINTSYPNDEYDLIVTLLNNAFPNLISDDEYKNYMKTFLQRCEDEKSHPIDFMYGTHFVRGVMNRPALYNDPEIFSLLLSRLRPLDFSPYTQHFVDQFHEYFETRQFEPWQTDLINAAKISSEKYYLESKDNDKKEYPKYAPKEEKSSKFIGPQTIFIIVQLSKKGYTSESAFRMGAELLLQPSILFDPIINLINASLRGNLVDAPQVGLNLSEANNILEQHSYYKYSDGALAIETLVDGSCLDFYSEADRSYATSARSTAHPVLKKDTIIQSQHVIGLHKIIINDDELNEKVPRQILNKESITYKEPIEQPKPKESLEQPKYKKPIEQTQSTFQKFFNKLFSKSEATSPKDKSEVSVSLKKK